MRFPSLKTGKRPTNGRIIALPVVSSMHERARAWGPWTLDFIEDGWFQMNPYSFYVLPSRELPSEREQQVASTIEALGLNDKLLVRAREEYSTRFFDGEISAALLMEEAPFV